MSGGTIVLTAMVVVVGAVLGGTFVAAFSATRPARVDVDVLGGRLHITLLGLMPLYAFRRQFDVPLGAIAAVRTAAVGRKQVRGLRLGGTALPGLLYAGTFRRLRTREFVAVRRSEEALVLDLRTEVRGYSRLILDVDDLDATAAAIEAAR